MSSPFSPLDAESDSRAEAIFLEALQRAPDDWPAFLAAECGSDAGLRAEIDALIRDHEEAGAFLAPHAGLSPALETEFARLTPEQVGDRIGPYKLLEQIGEGGFGTVWVAEQTSPVRRRVALKIIKAGMDTRAVIARFEQERQALALMDHPNIAKVLDAGATALGRPFFVMELVRGTRITDYCDQAQLPTADRLRLVIAICHAVQHAHQKGIIHRDLKPSNILVTLHDGVPVPKVIDFGVAKATLPQRFTDLTIYTQFEQMIGTPLYMAPEQAELSGLDIDTRSDIYSLGVLLYELLTGRTPFDPDSLMQRGLDEIRRVVREQEPQRPSTFLSTLAADRRTTVAHHRHTDGSKLIGQIRGDLDWIVMKALEKDRGRRYETATGLAQDIQRHLGSEPVQARPPSSFYRFRRFAKRNKLALAATAAIAAALVAGTAMSTWQSLRADREAKRANAALSDLRSSAPAFAEQARALTAQDKFDEAIEKLDFALKLRPDMVEYVLEKADLLQSQLRFVEASALYHDALKLSPGLARAQANAELCDTLAVEAATQPKLSGESLARLFAAMVKEGRASAQSMRIGRLVGDEKKVLLDYWLERLKDLPTLPDHPLRSLLSVTESGRLAFELGYTYAEDISRLRGMPLEHLTLSGFPNLSDLTPLQGMPLESLNLGHIEVDEEKILPACAVRDLAPLRGLALKHLNLRGTRVTDLTPLRGMPLKELHIQDTAVTDLSPLRGLPLQVLACNNIPALDFSALAEMPTLESLVLSATQVGDLSFLRKLPLKTLFLNTCPQARGLKVLSEIQTLEILVLPSALSDRYPLEELTAVEALRNHPRLRQIQLGRGTGGGPNSVTPRLNFWGEFDQVLRTRKALAQVAGGTPAFTKLPDRTWSASFAGERVTDLTPLAGTAISELDLRASSIVDVDSLKGIPLKRLDLGHTKVTNLQLLREHNLTELLLNDCPSGIDLSPLAEMATLETLALPPNPQNLEALRKLPNLQYLSFDYVPEDNRPRKWWQTAEQFWSDLPVETLARAGKFAEAEALLRERLRSSGSTDWIALGAVVLAQRDDLRFRAFCNEMMTYLKTIGVLTASRIALSGPESGLAAADLNGMMQQVRAGKTNPKDGYFIMIEGLDDYRAGRYAKAIEVLTPLAGGPDLRMLFPFPGWTAIANAILPMAYHKNGDSENSKAAHTRALTAITANWPRRSTRGSWHDWLIAHLLLQEAEKLMGSDATPLTGK